MCISAVAMRRFKTVLPIKGRTALLDIKKLDQPDRGYHERSF
jgi:hypothetical protein